MKNKGFTLVGVLIGLCLLGIISVTVLPIISSSFKASSKYLVKKEMIYLGEMSIEKIKAYKYEDPSPTYILNTKVEDIIKLFNSKDSLEIILNSNVEYENYEIKLSKNTRSTGLWEVYVLVYSLKEEENNYVQYKALLPSK